MRELIKNERKKLFGRASTRVVLIIMAVLLILNILLNILLGMSSAADLLYGNFDYGEEETWQEQYNREAEYEDEMATSMKAYIDSSEGYDATMMYDAEHYFEAVGRASLYRYLIDNEIDPTRWENDVLIPYYQAQAELATSRFFRDSEKTDESLRTMCEQQEPAILERIAAYEKQLSAKDWKTMLKAVADSTEDKAQKKVCQLQLDLGIKPLATQYLSYSAYHAAMAGEDTAWKNENLQKLRQNYDILYNGEDETFPGVVSENNRRVLESQNRVMLEELRRDIAPVTAASTPGLMDTASSAVSICTIFFVVIAGGLMANEFTSGTIKLLLITPHRRSKIYWSKVIVLTETVALTWPVAFLITFLIAGIFCRFAGLGVLQVVDIFGAALPLPFLLIVAVKTLVALLPVYMFATMAFMFSTALRRSAPAIALPLVISYMGTTVTTLLGFGFAGLIGYPLPGQQWLLTSALTPESYLPGVASEVNEIVELLMGELGTDVSATLLSCLLVLAFHIGCFLWIGRDSFTRRDI